MKGRILASGTSIAIAAALLGASPAAAHPHVWVTAKAELRFKEGKLTAIGLVWEFDELFGDYVKQEYDENQDGKFDEKETIRVAKEAFASLKDVGFLTDLRVKGKQVELGRPYGLEVGLVEGFVRYRFLIPLTAPLAPSRDWSLALYDESSYVDVVLAPDDPASLIDAPAGCAIDLAPDAKRAAGLFGTAPVAISVRCDGTKS